LILRTPETLRQWRRALRPVERVGFVPTMGALHEGHATLLREMRQGCDQAVLSIFVNPAQFGPNEDLAKYPRTFEADLAIARDFGVDVVYAPEPAAVYPAGYSTYVEEGIFSQGLCGATRPGHFRGVTTVVLKLLNTVEPHASWFGLKDAQQFFVLNKMARDLDLGTRLIGVPTVREESGLALSSRNRYLSDEERATAPSLYRVLKAAEARLLGGAAFGAEGQSGGVHADALAELARAGFRPQYLELRRVSDWAPVERAEAGQTTLLAAAAFLGATRLIDNVLMDH
jgi:pantoate--beta-alanine ligase